MEEERRCRAEGLALFWDLAPPGKGAAEASGAVCGQNHDRYGSVDDVGGSLAWFFWRWAETGRIF